MEFQSDEDFSRGEIIRRPSYRLVNQYPHSDSNPDGVRWIGEVFEKLSSWKSYLPNIFDRVRTKELKLEVTLNFPADWLSSKAELSRFRYHEAQSRLNQKHSLSRHLANNGSLHERIFGQKPICSSALPQFSTIQSYKDLRSDYQPLKIIQAKN